MKNEYKPVEMNNMEEFIEKLKNEDDRNLKISRNFQWVMWVLSLIYAYVFIIRGWHENTIYRQIGWSQYVLGFLSFGLIFNYLKRIYQQINYGLPTLMMLKEAAERYQLFQYKMSLVFTPILFIDAGMVLVIYDPIGHDSIWRAFFITQASIIPAVALGLFFGIRVWRKRQKPIRDFALRMIEELEQ